MRLASLMRRVASGGGPPPPRPPRGGGEGGGGARAFTHDGFSDDICLVAARREAAGV